MPELSAIRQIIKKTGEGATTEEAFQLDHCPPFLAAHLYELQGQVESGEIDLNVVTRVYRRYQDLIKQALRKVFLSGGKVEAVTPQDEMIRKIFKENAIGELKVQARLRAKRILTMEAAPESPENTETIASLRNLLRKADADLKLMDNNPQLAEWIFNSAFMDAKIKILRDITREQLQQNRRISPKDRAHLKTAAQKGVKTTLAALAASCKHFPKKD
jgi:hypothetical protein